MTDPDRLTRRKVLQQSGLAAGAAGLAGLAGCTGDGGDGGGGDGGDGDDGGDGGGGTTSFRVAGGYIEDTQCWDCLTPGSMFKIGEKVEEFSNGTVTADIIGGGEFCTETTCAAKVKNGLVQVAADSVANSSGEFPENNAWLLPRLFPNNQSIYHALTKPEAWEQYWVPFAEKYGAIPFTVSYATQRTLLLGKQGGKQLEGVDEITPDILSGLDVRRSADTTSSIVIESWGANPVSIQFTEFLQAMKEGAVAGVIAGPGNIMSFGGGPVVTDAVVNEAYHQVPIEWANVEWLKGLSSADREAIAEASRWIVEQQGRIVDEVNQERNGQADPVPEGSAFAENDIDVHLLSESELQAWRDPIDVTQNREKYSDIISQANQLFTGDDIVDFLHSTARESAVPDSPNDFELNAWWDDYIDQL
jgi:TRAP-type C4-dicarboxylate transport system substrate-binding protein